MRHLCSRKKTLSLELQLLVERSLTTLKCLAMYATHFDEDVVRVSMLMVTTLNTYFNALLSYLLNYLMLFNVFHYPHLLLLNIRALGSSFCSCTGSIKNFQVQ